MGGGVHFVAGRVFGLVLALLAGGCATQLPPAPAPLHEAYRYENRNLRVALSFPERWSGFSTRSEAPAAYAELMPRSKKADESPLVVAVHENGQSFARLLVETVPDGMTATEYFGRLHLALGTQVETVAVASADARDTVRWEYRAQQGALGYGFVEYVTVAGERACRLGFWSLAALVERHAGSFDSIAEDFRIYRGDAWATPWRDIEPLLDSEPYAHLELAPASGAPGPPDCEPGERSLLWRVRTERSTLHLFGSIHLGHPAFYPLAEPIEAAFGAAETLVVEIDSTAPGFDAEMAEATALVMLPGGTRLEDAISPELHAALEAELVPLGLSAGDFSNLSPVLMSTTLVLLKSLSLGYDSEIGVDQYFIDRAGAREIVSLETPREQFEMLASFDGELALQGTLRDIARMDEEAPKLIGAWRCGDEEGLEAALLAGSDDESPEAAEMRRRMYTDRNAKMADGIVRLLERGGSYFVVTGVGHMVGDDGIPALLSERGFVVEER